jgi:hypothetical protein
MSLQFTKAVKYGSKLRMALIGTSGSGKTYSSLAIASGLGKRIAFVDTEHGSARKYADVFDFDVIEFDSYAVDNFLNAIHAAEAAGYDVLIIDSLSHAWSGKDGLLEYVDMLTEKSRSKNAYTSGWREATPLHNRLIDTILASKLHIIACMRSKTEMVMQDDPRTGKKSPVKIGMQPVQREGMEYEFDVIGDMTMEHKLIVSKSRCRDIDGKIFEKPGADFAAILSEWLGGDTAPVDAPKPVSAPAHYAQAPAASTPPVQHQAPQAPAQSGLAAIPEPDLSPAAQEVYNALRKLLSKMHSGNLFGFGDNAIVVKHLVPALGVSNLRLVTNDHLPMMKAFLGYLTARLADQDQMPFDPIPLFRYDPTAVSVDPPQEAAVSAPGVAAPPAPATATTLDFDSLILEIDAEITKRSIPDSMAQSFAKSAMDFAEKKSSSITSILGAVKGYPLKPAPATSDVENLQSEVGFLMQQLVSGQIDGFHNVKRVKASIKKHLDVDRVNACTDAVKLAAYIVHLTAILNGEAKEEVA